MKTIEITNEQIKSLRNASAEAGDLLQCAVCDLARDRYEPEAWTDRLDDGERARLAGMSPEDARAECVRVIRNAEAQQ